jgi:hypothetical protein
MEMISVGRIVHYKLTNADVEQIQRRRTDSRSIRERIDAGQWPLGAQAHVGSTPFPGQVLPLIVVEVNEDRVWGQVFLTATWRRA